MILSAGLVSDQLEEEVEGGEVEVEVVAVEAVVVVEVSLKVEEEVGVDRPREAEGGILRAEEEGIPKEEAEVVEEVEDVEVEALAVAALLVEEVQVEEVQVQFSNAGR